MLNGKERKKFNKRQGNPTAKKENQKKGVKAEKFPTLRYLILRSLMTFMKTTNQNVVKKLRKGALQL